MAQGVRVAALGPVSVGLYFTPAGREVPTSMNHAVITRDRTELVLIVCARCDGSGPCELSVPSFQSQSQPAAVDLGHSTHLEPELPRQPDYRNIVVAHSPRDSADHAICARSLEEARDKLRELKKKGVKIDEVHIFDHGAEGYQEIGDDYINPRSPDDKKALAAR